MIRNVPEDVTKDTFYKGKVIVYQHKKGYRFSVDAPILADFLPFAPTRNALEIGTGSGIISLLALYKNKFSFIYGIEIQEGLGRLARLNGEKNGLSGRFKVITADFNGVDRDFAGITHIFSNPPFLKCDIGRLSPTKEIRDAKFETTLNLTELLTKSYSLLRSTVPGNLYLVLPYSRLAELEGLARDIGYYISRRRHIFSFKDGKPERFLVQLTNQEVSPANLGPLIIFKEKGRYTEEMENIVAGR
jgi:tRNA1(Val) A37 N6-methylase TrmN6